ncbi:MAG: VanZ family protein [Roseburia sp.]|nr:VanZ family protein [Roseburia sp.]
MAVTISAAIALFFLYCIIFIFSNQDGEVSGSVSYQVSKKCVELLGDVTDQNWNEERQNILAVYFEHPLRKLAHFTEFACMAALLYLLWRQWMDRGGRLFILVTVWVFLSAGLDELHQLFAPGRTASLSDVLLDTWGGIFGFLAGFLAERLLWHLYRQICLKRARR